MNRLRVRRIAEEQARVNRDDLRNQRSLTNLHWGERNLTRTSETARRNHENV
jgi:hypothetical protein